MEDGFGEGFEGRDMRGYNQVPRLIATVLSGALTGLFALAGAFTGAISGGLAGKASSYGFVRGAGLGAIAGAALSVEVLDASRSYWYSELSGSRTSSSLAEFVEELIRARFIEEQLPPGIVAANGWQNNQVDVNPEASDRGLSGKLLKNLPCHEMLREAKATESTCCPICLQDIKGGEIARSLPQCKHTFHLKCVDKWLIGHGSCPVCRQLV